MSVPTVAYPPEEEIVREDEEEDLAEQAEQALKKVIAMCPPGHLKGVVKLWYSDKSYGFITGEDGKDVFCHSKPNDGIALTPGLAVFYTVATQKGGKTWYAFTSFYYFVLLSSLLHSL